MTKPPSNVVVIDDHWWEDVGIENYSHLPPEHRMYARTVYICQKCDRQTRVWGAPPRIWDVQNRLTGESESGPADTHHHVAIRCEG